MSRWSQRSPNRRAWIEAVLGTATTRTPPGTSRRAASRIAVRGCGRCSSECQKTTAAHPSPRGTASIGSSRKSSRMAPALEPGDRRPRATSASSERPLAGADIEDRPRRCDLVEVAGEQAAGAPEDRVSGEVETTAPVPGSVPVAVGRLELFVVRKRIGGRGAACGAARSPVEAERATIEGRPAPEARLRRLHRRGRRQTAQRSSASARPWARSSKSSASIAAARGSSSPR